MVIDSAIYLAYYDEYCIPSQEKVTFSHTELLHWKRFLIWFGMYPGLQW